MRILNNKIAITPTVLQMEAVECGAAALGIILGYYGKFVALEELRENTGVSRDGVNAANIIKAAGKYNLEAEGIAIELPEEQGIENNLAELSELTFPCIVFWEFNHFLVVEGVKGQKIYLNDPASGRKSIDYQEFNHSFTGIVLEFTPNKHFKKGGEKTRFLPSLIKRLQGSLDSLILAIIISLLLILPGILIPGFTKIFIDNILVQQLQGWIKPLLLGMFLTLLLHMFLTWMQQKTLIQLSAKLGITASAKFLWHVFHLPIAFFDQRYVGDINNRIQANDRVALLLSGDVSTAMVSLFAVGFYAAVMLLLNVYLALIAIGFSLLNILVLNFFSRKLSDQSRKLSQESGKLHGVTMNGLQIIETLKTESLENIFFMRWAGFHAKKMQTEQKFELYSQLVITLPPLVTSLTTITTLLLGSIFIIEGTLSIGSLIALQSLILLFDKPIMTLVNSTVSLKEAEGDLARMDDVLNYKIDNSFSQPKKKFKNQKKRLNGKITLSNITYGYNKLEPPLIENLSITLEPGSQLALVGPSGSGKSTLAKIIAGIYTPWQGEVCFDDVPISEIPDELLKETLGVVNQEIYLFSGTIRDNITLWDDTISSHSLLRACQDAYIEAVIKERPERFEAQVTEGGANFSQGQRQRLEIARALIRDPNILILDEAFSALDPHIEKLIDNNIKRRECTSIIVAHRLSSIRDCDEILVLDKGKIIERGTHEEMLKKNRFYAKLIKSEKLT